MKAIYKAPGKPAQLVDLPKTAAAARRKLGGEFDINPALNGAQVLSLTNTESQPFNVHFLSGTYCGPILVVGKGENGEMKDLSERLTKLTLLALGKG